LAAEQERQVLASVTLQIFNSGAAAPGEIPGETGSYGLSHLSSGRPTLPRSSTSVIAARA